MSKSPSSSASGPGARIVTGALSDDNDGMVELEAVDSKGTSNRNNSNNSNMKEALRRSTITSSSFVSSPSQSSAPKTTTVIIEEPEGFFDLRNLFHRGVEFLKGSVPQQNSVDHDDLERTGFLIYIAFAFRFTFIFVILYVGITDYISQRRNDYLSPSPDAGECKNISVSIRSTYVSDLRGNWETKENYQSTESLYMLEFMGIEVSYEEYVANMKTFKERLIALSATAAQRDIGYTLVSLASFHAQDEGRTMEFKFNTDLPLLFDYYTADFSIANRDGFCVPFGQYPIYADYDANTAALNFEVMVFNETAKPCDHLIIDHYVNNNYAIQSDGTLPIYFDMRTISTAVAVNNGILKVKRDLKSVHSDAYNVTAYIDPNYSDMTPMACYPGVTDDDPDVCLVWSPDYFFMYPSITQMGNFTDAKHCDCPLEYSMRKICEVVSVIVGLLVINIEDRDVQQEASYNFTRQFVNLRKEDPVNGDLAASKLFFDAHIRSHTAVNTTAEERRQAFDKICGNVSCSLFHIELYGENPFININPQGMQLSKLYADRNPSPCEETLYQSTAFEPIIGIPPVSLQESYFVCKPYPTSAFQRALGVAAGSAEFYSSIVLSFIVFGVVTLYNRYHKGDKIIDPDEKKRMLEERVRSLEFTLESMQKELALSNQTNSFLQESNTRLQRQFDDFAKSFITVRNDVVGLKVDVARKES